MSLWIILTVAYLGVTMQIDRAVHDPKVYKTWHTVRNKLLGMSKEIHRFLALSDAATKSIDLAIRIEAAVPFYCRTTRILPGLEES
jgi:hypothetical protein